MSPSATIESEGTHRRPDYLGSHVKISDGVDTNRDLLLRPFPLDKNTSQDRRNRSRKKHTLSFSRSFFSSTNDPISMDIRSLTLSIAFCSISFVFADIWRYRGGSFSVAFVRSGYQIPLVPTDAPVSSWIYQTRKTTP
jgi:hypothetical protein